MSKTNTRKYPKRLFTLLLALVMVLAFVPAVASAADTPITIAGVTPPSTGQIPDDKIDAGTGYVSGTVVWLETDSIEANATPSSLASPSSLGLEAVDEFFETGTAYSAIITLTATSSSLSEIDSVPDSFAVEYAEIVGVEIESGGATAWIVANFEALPNWPTELESTAGNGQVTLTWKPPIDGGAFIGYTLAYTEDDITSGDVTWIEVISLEANVTTYTVTGLTNGVTYNFFICAINAAGGRSALSGLEETPAAPSAPYTPPSSGGTTTTPTTPSVVTDLPAVTVTPATPTAQWRRTAFSCAPKWQALRCVCKTWYWERERIKSAE